MSKRIANLLPQLRRLAVGQTQGLEADALLLGRFVRDRDEASFAALVARHGPLVRDTCRRLLADAHAADDAFQAVFLVLARKAASIRTEKSLAAWLHGVARRVALKARSADARRQSREAPLADLDPADNRSDPLAAVSGRELLAILDEELARLPEVLRLPIFLCCLEGCTQEEAAGRLGWTPGSVRGRLERGRARLHARLVRRGLTLPAALGAVEVSRGIVAAGVPAELAFGTVRAALAFAAGGTAVSARVAALAEGGLASMAAIKAKLGIGLLLAATVLAGVAGALAHQATTEGQPAAGPGASPPGTAKEPDGPKAQVEKPARTDCYGDPLPEEAVSRLGTLRLRHGEFVRFVRFTPDGKTLVAHGDDGVRIWDLSTGKQIRDLTQTTAGGLAVYGAALSTDGKLLATTSNTGIHLWNLAMARRMRSVGTGSYSAVHFSPDGKLLAALTSGWENQVEVLEAGTGNQLWSRSAGKLAWNCAAFTADGKAVVVAGWRNRRVPPLTDNTVRFLDATTGKEQRRIDLGTQSPDKIALSPDGSLLAAICYGEKQERHIRVWETAGGKERFRLDPPVREGGFEFKDFSALAFAPDDHTLLTAGGVDGLIVWDMATGKERRRIGRGMHRAADLAISPDRKTVAVATDRAAIRLIDRTSGADLLPTADPLHTVCCAAMNADGRMAVAASNGSSGFDLTFWDPTTGKERRRLEPGRRGWWGTVADGRKAFAVFEGEKALRSWDLDTGKELAPLDLDLSSAGPYALEAVAPAGTILVLRGEPTGDTLHLVDSASGKLLRSLREPGRRALGADFTADGRTLAIYRRGQPPAVELWDVASGAKLRQFGLRDTGVNFAVRLSPDGRWVACGCHLFEGEKQSLVLCEAATGGEVHRLDKLPAGAARLAFSPDSRMLAWGSWFDPVIHLVETVSGRERHSLRGHRGSITALAFSADGKTLVSGSTDSTALVWDLTGRVGAKGASGKRLTAGELNACWTDLANENAPQAFAALRQLAASPARAAAYLGERLLPIRPADEKRLAALIADLDSETFETRKKASEELEKLGEAALSGCRKALDARPSPEARRRLTTLLEKQTRESLKPSPSRLRLLRAVEVLEWVGTAEARQVLEKWAKGVPEARLTEEAKAALERLARRSAASP
jgi:RNA polymerase sigma factor (sigma-70 family)